MTVAELIEKLRAMPQDMKVMRRDDDGAIVVDMDWCEPRVCTSESDLRCISVVGDHVLDSLPFVLVD